MNYELTQHTRNLIEERQISIEWLERALCVWTILELSIPRESLPASCWTTTSRTKS
jgi:hypothetical protein